MAAVAVATVRHHPLRVVLNQATGSIPAAARRIVALVSLQQLSGAAVK
jgi:hypothetical protein